MNCSPRSDLIPEIFSYSPVLQECRVAASLNQLPVMLMMANINTHLMDDVKLASACCCRKEILGIVLVKELVLIDMHASTRVADLRIRSLPYLRADIAMYDLLKLFQTGRSHMVVLTKPPEAAADGTVSRANSADVTVQIEEAKDRLSPEVGPVICTLYVFGSCIHGSVM